MCPNTNIQMQFKYKYNTHVQHNVIHIYKYISYFIYVDINNFYLIAPTKYVYSGSYIHFPI